MTQEQAKLVVLESCSCDKCQRQLAELRLAACEKERDALRTALTMLYEETADYIRLNDLGAVHHNRSMRMARAALAPAQAEAPDTQAFADGMEFAISHLKTDKM